MGIKNLFGSVTQSIEDADREELIEFSSHFDATPLDEVIPRAPGRFVGEIRSIRIVPRAGADALEIDFTDGRGSAVAVFLGRRRIDGLTPSRRIMVEGAPGFDNGRTVIVNPVYTLLS